MKNFSILPILLALFTLSVLGTSCEKENNQTPENESAPTITLELGEIGTNSGEISYTIADATVAKYLCTPATEQQPDLETILSNGTTLDLNQSTLTLDELIEGTTYTLSVAARNIELTSSESIEFTTSVETPCTCEITPTEVGTDFISFTISAENATTIKYLHIVSGSRDVTPENIRDYGTDAANSEEVTITGLESDTTYEVHVLAENQYNYSTASVEMTTKVEVTTYNIVSYDAASNLYEESYANNYYIKFVDNETDAYLLIDFYDSVDSPYLTSGTYPLTDTYNPGEIYNGYTSFSPTGDDADRVKFSSGEVTVVATPNEETKELIYSINGSFIIENSQDIVNFTFEGDIYNLDLPNTDNPDDNAYEFVVSPETNTPHRVTVNGEVPGEYYIKFYDSNWNELTLDIFIDPTICNDGKAGLPAGTYTVADGEINTVYSVVSLYNPYFNGNFTDCTLEVSENNGEYTFSLRGTAESSSESKLIVMNYTGEILSMVRE